MSKCEDMLGNENLSPLTLDDEWDKSSSSNKKGDFKSRITDDEVIKSLFMSNKEREMKCNFYFKIGACRHGDRCTKSHREPTYSQTVLLKNLYWSPLNQFKSFQQVMPLHQYTAEELQQHFDETYEELYVEIERKYGEIEELLICDNIAEHLAGNAYIKFRFEEDAERAVLDLNNRWFNLKPIYAELSPVTDFTEARCQHEFDNCPRNGHCNFLHIKEPSSRLVKKLRRFKRARSRTPRPRSRSRSRSLPWLSELYVKRLDTSRSRSRSIDNSKRSSSSSKSSSSSSKRSRSSKKKHHSKHRSHHRHRHHHHRKHKRS